jgi:ribosome maturation factor RimP
METLKPRIETVLTELGYYLYDVEYVKEDGTYVLRIKIENDAKITLDDCITVSEHIGAMLDDDDPFEDAYHLEVTSAGAERILHTSDQIKRQVGELVHVETFEQTFTGQLIDYQDGSLTIRFKTNKQTVVNEMDINLIRLTLFDK